MDTMRWKGPHGGLELLDQRKLPVSVAYEAFLTCDEVTAAIGDMVVRGAPAIGVAAAYGMVLAAVESLREGECWRDTLARKARVLSSARPTAVNLKAAVHRMMTRARTLDVGSLVDGLNELACEIEREDAACCRAMGQYGQSLLDDGDRVLTHCNAGALATAGIGTALGVIRAAVYAGKKISVLADETRPYLQGARLTAAELMDDDIPVTLICDSMAGWMMKTGQVDKVIVGADRIAANGDTANKIGTYSLAVLARHHGIHFFVAAPLSTLDMTLIDGTGIPIEQRDRREVTHFRGDRIAPLHVGVMNPAFDVTPAALINAIITDEGIARPPFIEAFRKICQKKSRMNK